MFTSSNQINIHLNLYLCKNLYLGIILLSQFYDNPYNTNFKVLES